MPFKTLNCVIFKDFVSIVALCIRDLQTKFITVQRTFFPSEVECEIKKRTSTSYKAGFRFTLHLQDTQTYAKILKFKYLYLFLFKILNLRQKHLVKKF